MAGVRPLADYSLHGDCGVQYAEHLATVFYRYRDLDTFNLRSGIRLGLSGVSRRTGDSFLERRTFLYVVHQWLSAAGNQLTVLGAQKQLIQV